MIPIYFIGYSIQKALSYVYPKLKGVYIMNSLTKQFISKTKAVHGEKGLKWIDTFPLLLESCQQQWTLTLQQPFPHLSYNYVQPVTTADGKQRILKLFVDKQEFQHEIEALKLFNGNGIVPLIDYDIDKGALLLEHLSPGHTLSTIRDDGEATIIAATVMKQLRYPLPTQHTFTSVEVLAYEYNKLRNHFGGSTGPLPSPLVEKAELLFPELVQSTEQQFLLHGDLHHDNILSTQDGWLAIDPKGLIGEVEYETIPFLCNYLVHHPSPLTILEHRVNQFVDILHLNRERLLCWGLCHSIISAWWFLEENSDGWKERVACAHLFDELMTKGRIR
jgi:streptomycin 6-kinase